MAEEFGIHPYYQSGAPEADLVLIHGLMGNSTDTWTGKDDKGQPTYWPDWIKEIYPNVNIWRADYKSSLDAWLQPAMSLDQIAAGLLVDAHDQGLGIRPIHWVGHSMGGLVIKHLLCRAQIRVKPGLHNISTVPTGITFLGTPHHGSDVADWKGFFGGLLTALDLIGAGGAVTGSVSLLKAGAEKLRNAQIESHVEQLSVHSRELGRLNENFSQWLASADMAGRLIDARNYYELLPIRKTVVVVPERSAKLSNAAIEDIPSQEHHLSICKYSSRNNPVFKGLNASLRNLCAQKTTPGSNGGDGFLASTRSRMSTPQPDDRIDRAWRSALERCSVNVLAQICIEFKGVLGDCRPTLHDLESALEQVFQTEGSPRAFRAHIKEALPGKAGGLSIDERCDRDRLYVMLLIQSVALTYRASVQGETMGELVVPDRERQFAVAAAAHIVLGLGVQLTVQPGAVSIDNLIDTAGCADAAACPPGRVPSDNPLEDELKRWVGRLSKGESSPESTADLKASLALQEQREHARPILLDSIGMLTDPALRILVRSLDIGAVDTAVDGRPANISPGLWSDLCGQLDNQIVWLNNQSTSVPAIAHPPAQVSAQMPPAEPHGPMVQVNITGAVGQSNVSTGSHSPIHAQHVAAAMPADTQTPLSVELFALEMTVCDRPHLQQHLLAISLVVQQRQLTAHAMGVLRSALPELRGAAAGSDDVRVAWRTLCQAVHVHWPESSAFFN